MTVHRPSNSNEEWKQMQDRASELDADLREAFRMFHACPNVETEADLRSAMDRFLEVSRELRLWEKLFV